VEHERGATQTRQPSGGDQTCRASLKIYEQIEDPNAATVRKQLGIWKKRLTSEPTVTLGPPMAFQLGIPTDIISTNPDPHNSVNIFRT